MMFATDPLTKSSRVSRSVSLSGRVPGPPVVSRCASNDTLRRGGRVSARRRPSLIKVSAYASGEVREGRRRPTLEASAHFDERSGSRRACPMHAESNMESPVL